MIDTASPFQKRILQLDPGHIDRIKCSDFTVVEFRNVAQISAPQKFIVDMPKMIADF